MRPWDLLISFTDGAWQDMSDDLQDPRLQDGRHRVRRQGNEKVGEDNAVSLH